MQRGRFIFAAVAVLAIAGARLATTPAPAADMPAPAATPPAAAPKDVVNLDFSKADVASQLQINGDGKLVTDSGKQRLRLTDGSGQVTSVFTKTPVPPVSDYLATFDIQVQGSDANSPADGAVIFMAQTAGADHIGEGGNNMGLTTKTGRGPGTQPNEGFPGYSYGLAYNSISSLNQADPELVELELMGTKTRLNPTPVKLSGEGLVHASVRVQPNQMALTLQGGKSYTTAKTVWTTPAWIGNGLFVAPKPVFFGFLGAEGGGMVADVFNLRIQSPAP